MVVSGAMAVPVVLIAAWYTVLPATTGKTQVTNACMPGARKTSSLCAKPLNLGPRLKEMEQKAKAKEDRAEGQGCRDCQYRVPFRGLGMFWETGLLGRVLGL